MEVKENEKKTQNTRPRNKLFCTVQWVWAYR